MSDALENAVTVQLKMQDRISELEAALNKAEAERDEARAEIARLKKKHADETEWAFDRDEVS